MLGRSIQLGRIFGIRIGANPSWFVVLFLLIWLLTGQYKDAFPGHDTKAFGLAVASALLLFFCVLLHELGHALVARRNRVPIAGIELWLFGGIATMTREPPSGSRRRVRSSRC
jgi:Zn-dependent protease